MSDTPPPGPEPILPAERPLTPPPNLWQHPPEDPFSAGEGFDWRRYVAVFLRFKWLIVLVTVLGTAAGVAATRFIAPQYEAEATVLIEATSGGLPGQGPIQQSELFRNTAWLELLKTPPVLDSVVVDMQLYLRADSAVRPRLSGFGIVPPYHPGEYRFAVSADGGSFTLTGDDGQVLQRGTLGDSVGQELGFRWAPDVERFEARSVIEFTVANVADVSENLAEAIQGRLDRNGNFMHLTFTGSNRARTAAVLDAVTNRFVQVATELKDAKLEAMKTILADQRRTAEESLRSAQEELERFRVRTATLPTEPGYPIIPGMQETNVTARSMYRTLLVERDEVRADRDIVQRALAQAPDSGLAIVALEGVAARYSPELASALSDLTQKRADLSALRNKYYDDHVLVRAARADARDSEQRVIDLGRRLIQQLEAEDEQLGGRIESAAGELGEIPTRAITEDALERRVESAETFYGELQVRHEEALLAEASKTPDVRVFSPATATLEPVNAKDKPRLMLMAFLASLGLGVGLAVLIDRMDPRVKSPDELERLGLRILGTVPHVNTGQPTDALGNVAEVVEAFRLIRLNVTHAHGTAGPIVLAITSPTGSEGKSFVSANLGLAFSFLGLRTLVIDADVRKGRVHRLLGGHRRPGLTDYLGGAAALEQVIKPAPHQSLYRITSGSRRQDGPELLQSPAMGRLLADLRPDYDVLIVDTPPIGVGADALALATLAGNLILVVRTGSTNRELTETKLDFIFRLPVRVLGTILNDVPARGAYGYYGSAYYSSYLPGYESKDENDPGSWGSG